MPRPDPAKRTPLWLQRLRAKDLLQVVRKFPDFPIVVETYRECLDDDLDLPRLRSFLDAVAAGAIRVVTRQGEIASPFASELIFRFTPTYLYQWDEPRRADLPAAGPAVDEDLLDPLLRDRTRSTARPAGRRPGRGPAPRPRPGPAHGRRDGRDAPALGDLTPSELSGPMETLLASAGGGGSGPDESSCPGPRSRNAGSRPRSPTCTGWRSRPATSPTRRPWTRSSAASSGRMP